LKEGDYILDSYSSSRTNVSNSIKINAVTGNILKNYQKSFFKRFKLDSTMAKQLFDEELPHLSKYTTEYYNTQSYSSYQKEEKRPVVIVQMMICGESEVLAEIMWKDDFDELFKE
jgi:formyltetrahydrofolate hydrolase